MSVGSRSTTHDQLEIVVAEPFRFMYHPSDYEATVAFYRDLLGFEVLASWDDDGLGTILGGVTGQIELFGGAPARSFRPRPAAASVPVGLAWEVDDVDGTAERLTAAGVEIVEEPTDQPWGKRSVTIGAPDGIVVTLFVPLDRPDFSD